MSTKPKSARRCLCHKQMVYVEYGVTYDEIIRFCPITRKKIKKEQTYLSTMESPEEVKPPDQPRVERGCIAD